MADITMIDYGSGNLLSIYNAFKSIGADINISDDKKTIADSDALILPGVGAYGAVMNNLVDYKDIVYEYVDSDKPLLGICLGLQMLFTTSDESPNIKGLDIFKGHVKRFDLPFEYKIPHMGWNQITVNKTEQNNTSLVDEADNKYMYFVHSYYIQPEDESIITAYCDYGMKVPVAVGYKNIHALQFHPEKSGSYGLDILKKFINSIE